ncbi:MAG: hypothetical protein OIF48_12710 [Silicimonas sp.]|jgi:hypothetical protein|nr:hypothetical protein [Silicimonas sp.]
MGRLIFGAVVFLMILCAGVIWTATPGNEADFEEARARILAAKESGARLLRLRDLDGLGALPEELADLDTLVQLDLSGTVISDLAPVSGLTSLRILTLRDTLVEDLSPLEDLENLDILDLGGSWVRDLTPLAGLPKLGSLDIGRTWVASLAPLSEIEKLDWVNLAGAQASDGSRPHLETLRARGVTLNNPGAFARDARPGITTRMQIRLDRLARRIRLGLGG